MRDVGEWMDEHHVRLYSEHLSYTGDDGQLYDLLPIPFTGEACATSPRRIRRVQDILGRRIAVENVSYYASMGAEMQEGEFLAAVLEEADCGLLLDVNNVYVNSVNHDYGPARLPGHRAAEPRAVHAHRGSLRRSAGPADRHARRDGQG